MDQTLGQPVKQIDKNRATHTIGARLIRVEDYVIQLHLKLDQCVSMLTLLPDLKNYKQQLALEYKLENQNKNENDI